MPNTRKTILSIFAVVMIGITAVLIGTALSRQKEPMRRKAAPETTRVMETVTVENTGNEIALSMGGHIHALDKVELYAEVSGVLRPTPRRFKEGNRFARGEVLIQIDDSVYRNNLLAQRSSLLNQLTLLLPDLSIDFPDRAADWEAYLNGFDIQAPLKELPEPRSDKEKYYIAAKNIYNLFYSIRSMEVTLAKYTLEAPYAGVVTLSSINPGTLVRAGQKLGEFTSTAVYEMEAFAGLGDVPRLSMGQLVHLTCDDLPGEFEGRIQRISGIIDRESQTVKVYIRTSSPALREGLYMTASLDEVRIEASARLPRSALVGRDQVWVVEGSRLALATVSVAADDERHLIVQGLADGTEVVKSPPADAYEGMVLPNGQTAPASPSGPTSDASRRP